MSRNFVIGTAGHVDHGKSALVKALTGTDPDRLPEEKARGITIDLGFAHFVLSGTGSRGDLRVGIVDVPGHEDFVKNMVSGVGAINLALLVIAADDGWMPQTEEHLQILTYLRVPQAIVALTKIDVVAGREASCLEAVRGKLRETPFADAPIVCTSTVSGHGLDQLKTTLAATLEKMEPSPDLGKPRLPVDRVFTLRGVGMVVTGTLSGGSLRRGDLVTVQPGGHRARIRSLQNHNEEIEVAMPGMRTALNLPDLHPNNEAGGRGGGGSTVERGDVLADTQAGEASSTIDVLLERSGRLIDSKTVLPPLKHEKRVRVHHGSGNVPARVLLNCPQLIPGERALAQLQLDRPLLGFVGDRFIIRDWAEQRTLAGGIILDADASRGAFRSVAQQEFLAMRSADLTATTLIASQLERDGVVERRSLLIKSHFSRAELDAAIRELAGRSMIIEIGASVADAQWWKQLSGKAAETIDRWHAEQPQQPGLPLNALRSIVERDARAAGRFEAIIAELSRHGFEQVGAHVRRKTHRPALPAELQAAGGKMRTALRAKPLEPPSRKELTIDPAAQQALRFLIDTGEAVEIGSELVLLAEACEQARALVREFLTRHHSATVSELRQALGTNRRVIVPLLEYFDRAGVTRRLGDKRVLREPV